MNQKKYQEIAKKRKEENPDRVLFTKAKKSTKAKAATTKK